MAKNLKLKKISVNLA